MFQRVVRSGTRMARKVVISPVAIHMISYPLSFQQVRHLHLPYNENSSQSFNDLGGKQPVAQKQDLLNNQIQAIRSFDDAIELTRVYALSFL